MNNVYEFIENLNINSEYVIAAVSGGPDSMFLLDTLIKLRDKLNFKIVVAHVHHNLRRESNFEAEQVEKYCLSNDIIFEMKKIERYPDNKFSEESARKIRYLFFDEVVKKYNSNILFTAHHGDDLVETILMRISRGASLKGYAGFERITRDRGYIIARPLIYLSKSEIKEYLDELGVWYATDLSNESDKYTRNRYRKYILPELKKENVNIHFKYVEFNEKLVLVDKYLKKQVESIYNDIVSNNEIDVIKFNELDEIIKEYLLEKYLKDTYNKDIGLINNKHVEIIINLLLKSNNSIIDFPCDKKGILEYNKFKIAKNTDIIIYDYTFEDYIELPNGHIIEIDNSTDLSSNFVIHLDSKELSLPLHVRTRKDGDRMSVKNMSGTKKINDIFTDLKISRELRDSYPIVTDDKGIIIWVPGIKKSQLDRKKEGKYDIILKYT